MSHPEKNFRYFLARKAAFLVVSLVGKIDSSVLGRLLQCKDEIQGQLNIRGLVLHFSDVSEISVEAIPLLVQIQHAARTREIALRLSGLSPELLDKLNREGVIRKQELATDLREALIHFERTA